MDIVSGGLAEYLSKFTFRNNPNLRPCGVTIEYTQEMVDEYKKCYEDPIYFISNYVKVVHPNRGIVTMELYDYQKRMIKAYHENRRIIFLTARQQGKCLLSNTLIKIRNKTSGEIVEIAMGDFYEWQKFKKEIDKYSKEELQESCEYFYRSLQYKDSQDNNNI